MENGNKTFNGTNETDYVYIYDYDYNASVNTIPLEEFVPVAIVYGLTLLLGVIGNLLVIFSITRYRRMQSVTNIFLVSLSSADLILVLICVPIKFAKFFSFTWNFGEFLCKSVHYLQNVSVICSVLTLTIMSMERYYAIIHPMRAKYTCTGKRAKGFIIVIWIASFLLATPIILGQVHKQVGMIRVGYWCIKEWTKPLYSKLYETGMLILILILPLLIMTFAYSSIARELWIVSVKRASMRGDTLGSYSGKMSGRTHANCTNSSTKAYKTALSVDDASQRKQVIKMLVAVIVLFTICWAPSLIDNVLVAFGLVGKLNYGHLKHLRQAFALMSYFNSCVNPVVYAFMSKNFRATFKYALCSCVKGRNYARTYRYSRQTTCTSTHGSTFAAPTATSMAPSEYKLEMTSTPSSSYHLVSSNTQESFDYKL